MIRDHEARENGVDYRSIVGSDEFSLTEKDVLDTITDIQDQLDGLRESLNDSDERVRVIVERTIPSYETQLVVLSSGSPEEILSRVRAFYDRVKALEVEGLSRNSVAEQINDEFPNLNDYYFLLRMSLLSYKQGWGYRLGQAVIAAGVRKSI